MNISELKAEANALGYSIAKKIVYEKVLNCICGSKRVVKEISVFGKYYRCTNCGYTSERSKTKYQAIQNWNKLTQDINAYTKYIGNKIKGDK